MRDKGLALDIRDLAKVYHPRRGNPVRALEGVSLQVHRGEIYGLLGRNGAGKTTLLRILTTLIPPSSGEVSVLGFDLRRQASEVRQHLCVVLQENAVELYLSVEDNLATYARFHSLSRSEVPARIDRVIAQFDLQGHRKQKVIDLSGGLRRRVQVAKVFLVEKPLVFLDEATVGMDPINKRATLDAIRDQAKAGRTIFLTTHILEEAEELCDTIAIIDRGRILASGDLPTIKSLVPNAFDVSITFQALDEELLGAFRQIPSLRLSHTRSTVDVTIPGSDLSVLESVAQLAQRAPVLHLEMHSATLEDVFLELLGHPTSADGQEGDR
jgi:ABC-2 type transport system ATP-binding protein